MTKTDVAMEGSLGRLVHCMSLSYLVHTQSLWLFYQFQDTTLLYTWYLTVAYRFYSTCHLTMCRAFTNHDIPIYTTVQQYPEPNDLKTCMTINHAWMIINIFSIRALVETTATRSWWRWTFNLHAGRSTIFCPCSSSQLRMCRDVGKVWVMCLIRIMIYCCDRASSLTTKPAPLSFFKRQMTDILQREETTGSSSNPRRTSVFLNPAGSSLPNLLHHNAWQFT